MPKKKMGRPCQYTDKEKAALLKKFNEYIDTHDIPVLEQFCYQNNVSREFIYYDAEFSTVLEKFKCKKTANLEIGGLQGKINVKMAMFSLKQQGWTEKTEVKHEGNIDTTIKVELTDD